MWHDCDVLMVVNNGTHFLTEIREAFDLLHITYEVIPGYGSLSDAKWQAYSGVILTGGEIHVYEPEQLAEVTVDEALLNRTSMPVLGICLGHQLIAHHYGAKISPLPHSVDQEEIVQLLRPNTLFDDLPQRFLARVAHDDAVTTLPRSLVQLASSTLGHRCVVLARSGHVVVGFADATGRRSRR